MKEDTTAIEFLDFVPNGKKKQKENKKTMTIFLLFSAIFCLCGCIYLFIFINNTKEDYKTSHKYLSDVLLSNNNFNTINGNNYYYGNVNNNYIKYNNLLWRIVRVNNDKSITIILDDYINILPKQIKKETTVVSEFLSTSFLNNLDKNVLVNNNICNDEINDLDNITCNDINSSEYISLLDINSFIYSMNENETYLAKDSEIFWLNNNSKDEGWITFGNNISKGYVTDFYEIRPVVTLKNDLVLLGGKGTDDFPYYFEEEKFGLGSIVSLDEDNYVVIDTNNTIKLLSSNLLDSSYKYNDADNYLNNTYYNNLSYKDMIVKSEFEYGQIKNSLSDSKNETKNNYIGLPSIMDIKFDSFITDYFLSNNYNSYYLVYKNSMLFGDADTDHFVRYCINLDKSIVDDLVYENGIYRIGVKNEKN